MPHKLNSVCPNKDAFCLVKTHSPFRILFGQETCVATSGALRFSCVVPFGATHFFYRKVRGENKKEERG